MSDPEIRQVPKANAATYYRDGWKYLGLIPYPLPTGNDHADDLAFARWLAVRDDIVISRG